MSRNNLPVSKPSLEQVRDQFETWRRTRRVRQPIPEPLWQAAVEQCADQSVLQVSRALRLNYTDLKTRVEKAKALDVCAPGYHADFVELDFGASMPPLSECVVEMERPDGAKMKMHFKGQRGFDPVILSEAFWRQGL